MFIHLGVCIHVYMHECVHEGICATVGMVRPEENRWSQLSPSIMWALGIKFASSGLWARTITH